MITIVNMKACGKGRFDVYGGQGEQSLASDSLRSQVKASGIVQIT